MNRVITKTLSQTEYEDEKQFENLKNEIENLHKPYKNYCNCLIIKRQYLKDDEISKIYQIYIELQGKMNDKYFSMTSILDVIDNLNKKIKNIINNEYKLKIKKVKIKSKINLDEIKTFN